MKRANDLAAFHPSTSEGCSDVRAFVVRGVKLALNLEYREGAAIDLDGAGFTVAQLARV